ncbi:MAG: site-specific DNA-methyltransferase [Verrucomicrobia bacterium]|nr:site-specific DNA-methyltransferase [Verrucomicrobiota bacterium]MCH8526345.1 site-specific DNA-methyltransferase [Kiritimatiellia bacterium]
MPTLDWIGKDAVIRHHKEVPFRLLEPDAGLSAGGGRDGNLIVQGDNLHALKALLPKYAGRVKCIYIDPPYNTGNEGWVYNDNSNAPEIKKWLGEAVGKEAEDLCRHDKWLCMMYPRLVLLKQFLRPDGSIWISMDDSEIHNLRSLMDEIFGLSSFVACNTWQKRYSRENRGSIGDAHEYLLVYAPNPKKFQESRNLVPLTEKQAKVYKNPNNDPKGRWRGIPMTAQGYRPNQMYEITTPSGKKIIPPEGRCWSTIESEFLKLLTEGRIYFGKKGDSQPSIIRFLSEVEGFVPWTWWPHDEVGHTDEAKKEIRAIFGTQTAFDTPKPTRLLQRIIQIATDKGDMILDSFAGSGTTGHAVLKQNAEDGGTRKFILVEMEENIARDITAERVRRVSAGYADAKGKVVAGLGGGFQFCRLSGEPLFNEFGDIREDVTFAQLADFVWFSETGLGYTGDGTSPLLGVHEGRGIYLLFNGILGDRRPQGGNILTRPVLDGLPVHEGPKVIYAAASRLGASALQREQIVFKQTPYAIEV